MFKCLSKKKRREFFAFVLCVLVCYIFMISPTLIYANEGLKQLNDQLSLFKELVASLVSAVGAVVLMWSIFKMGMAMQAGGNSGMEAQSIGAIGGGILMMAAPQLILIFSAPTTSA